MSETVAARWEEYNESGRRSFGLGQFAEAEELFRAAVREGEQLGADSPHLATSLNALGQIRLQAKDLAEAESCFSRALVIRQQTYGPDSHAIVPSLNNLSALHDAKGETEKAVELLRRSLAISEQSLGASHPEVALALTNLAKLHFKRRDFSKADRLLLRLLETKRALGKDHPEVATVLGSLAKLRQAVGKHGPAEQLWRQALSIRERAFAPNDSILATTLEHVADCCAAQDGRLGDAIALRQKALAIREVAMGAAHPSIATARAKLDELRSRPGGSAVPDVPNAPPARSSQEIPSPLLSHEVPPYPAGHSAPSPDLPWIQLDGDPTGERQAPRLELMSTEPPMPVPARTQPPARVPLPDNQSGVPRPPLVPSAAAAISRSSRELVFTESLAPEATPVEPRHPERGGHNHPAPPRATRAPRDGAAPARRPVRMPATMSESDGSSKKALLVAVVLVAIAGAGGWFALGRKLPLAVQPLAAAFTHVTNVAGATFQHSRPVASPGPATPASSSPAAPVPPPTNANRSGSRSAAPVTAERAQVKRVQSATDSAQRAERIQTATPAESISVNLSPPSIDGNSEIDAVTRGIEQSTTSKLDSAQKARLEPKAPIFKKP